MQKQVKNQQEENDNGDSQELMQIILDKYCPSQPNDPGVIFFTTEELYESFNEEFPFISATKLGIDLKKNGFRQHDIGDREIVLKWCFKLKNQ